MHRPFPPCRIGPPRRHGSLTVFSLFTVVPTAPVRYRLACDALADGTIVVSEIGAAGSVPELEVTNAGDARVLFLEGEELVGAKQNRVLNVSLLVPAGARMRLPVSCVEQGRWRYATAHFDCSGTHVPAKLRHVLKGSVSRSVAREQGHRSDQGSVWQEVAALQTAQGVASNTLALSDTFAARRDRIGEFLAALPHEAEAVGLALAVNDQVLSVDLFDDPGTCRRVWPRIVSGAVFDALAVAPEARDPDLRHVEAVLALTGTCDWREAPAVGEGVEYRASTPQGDEGTQLTCADRLVHGSLVLSA